MPAHASTAPSRRAFLTGKVARPEPEFRPPWTDEARVQAQCTGCNACVEACPQGIIEFDSRSRPRISFHGGECTFCGACAEACPQAVFDLAQPAPWPVTVEITSSCLNAAGIACQLCTDICDPRALRMDLSVRPVGAIQVDPGACTGCGACLSTCPNNAIALCDPRQQRTPA
ncbi:ferredoxin-type protein NapF [Leisingera sp. M527]|uniref:ferredoxin-type protein NapF n=1 Tax=unclassified Leisingera TaxID=2614906 RepID=UPI0021A3787C|nr:MULTISPECIES: ferredoxin-type protein NapF [unclassified Leisingera]UWQ28942.1 ferredoxin-type protein NapF [Leisingera sp. M523]UWQ32628.1 ferredoxin-type protein NapF [Leisingera sp. M527]